MIKKEWASIFVLVALISFSGCMTTACRGKEKGSLKIPAVSGGKEKVSVKIPAAALVAPEPTFIRVLTERPANIPATLTWGADGSLDAVNDKPAQQLVTVMDKAKVKLLGWAGNIEKGTVPQDVYLEFEGPTRAYFKITTRLKRPDVVAYLKKPGLKDSGWVAYADLTALAIGTYKVKIVQIEGKAGSLSDTSRSFKLIDSILNRKDKLCKTAPKTVPDTKVTGS